MNSTHLIYFAPFQGITNRIFRTVYLQYFQGIDKIYTPYFAGINKDNKLSSNKTKELNKLDHKNVKLIPQILSKDIDEIVRFAAIIESMGFDELNWNLGCPAPQVASKKRGSGMLAQPEMIDRILSGIEHKINIRFSIKCRLGYESAQEFRQLIPIFNQHNLSELIIHARVGKQMYKGTTDLQSIIEYRPLLNMPVVYNGDIFSKSDFQQLEATIPDAGKWMIGRGILQNPFLAATIKGIPTQMDKEIQIKQFVESLYINYRRQMHDSLAVIGFMKEYWQYLAVSFDNPIKVFKKLKKANTFEEYEAKVEEIFKEFNWVKQE